jgi:hypothetical protein
MATPNRRKWIKIGDRTYITREGDTVKFLARDLAMINDKLVKGGIFIREKVGELSRK